MKVKLLTYFSVGGVKIPKGTVFVGTFRDLPDWVQKEVKGKSKAIEVSQTPKAEKVVSPSEEEIKAQKEAEEAKAEEVEELKAKEAEEFKAKESEDFKAKEAEVAEKTKTNRIIRKSKDK